MGEACHYVDLARAFIGAAIKTIRCSRRDTDGQDGGCFELDFSDGSTAMIDYRTDLPAHTPKELVTVSGEGWGAVIHNWARLTTKGLGGLSIGRRWSRAPSKGHPEALAAFLFAVRNGGQLPIPLEEILEVSRVSIMMQAMGAGSEFSLGQSS